ncbi:MAG TPA: hypothetical protein VN752_05785 [Solirubrobacterales bacterium]|nr:hypothetical protein [Solirubrobacterales bacterium]
MSAERASVPPNPERSERAYLILRERSEGEVTGVWFFAPRAVREAMR